NEPQRHEAVARALNLEESLSSDQQSALSLALQTDLSGRPELTLQAKMEALTTPINGVAPFTLDQATKLVTVGLPGLGGMYDGAQVTTEGLTPSETHVLNALLANHHAEIEGTFYQAISAQDMAMVEEAKAQAARGSGEVDVLINKLSEMSPKI